MLPYIGSQFGQLPAASPYEGLATHLAGCTLSAVMAPWAYRGLILYTSQIETRRSSPGPECLNNAALEYKGTLNAIWKQVRDFKFQSYRSLFRGGLTIVAMVPISSLGAWSMSYHFMQSTVTNDRVEASKNVFFGFASVLAAEYLNAPLRALYLQQAASTPSLTWTDGVKVATQKHWLPYYWKPGAHAFALSSVLFSATFLTGLMFLASTHSSTESWRRHMLREPLPELPVVDETVAAEIVNTPKVTTSTVLLALSGPVLALGTTFTFLVGLRQFFNHHAPHVNPSFKYTKWWQPWLYQLRAGPRALFFGFLSSSLLWSSTPNKLFAVAATYTMLGGADDYRARIDRIHEEERRS